MEIWGTTNAYTINSVEAAVGGNTAYTGVFNIGSFPVGSTATVSGFTDGFTANNGTFTIVSCTSTVLTLANAGGLAQNPTLGSGSPPVFPIATSPLTPVYMKLEYGCSATAADPQLSMQFGTGWSSSASGYLTGNVSLTEELFSGAGTIAATECDYCGDGGTFFVANMFRGGAANPGPAIFGWERSIAGLTASAPVYASTYITYLKGYSTAAQWWQQTLFLSGNPAVATRVNYANTITLGAQSSTLIVNGTSPALPVFPLAGYCGNPMTILVGMQTADVVEGTVITCTVYGRTNAYLLTKTTFAGGFGWNSGTSYAVGTRYDSA